MLAFAELRPHHPAPLHPIVWVSLINWQACGIGLAFGGSVVLALGLLSGVRSYALRTTRSGNSSLWQNVQAAENRADAQTGVLALVIGFGVQAVTTVWIVDHAAPTPVNGLSWLVTVGWALVPAVAVLVIDHKIQWLWVRRYLVRLARYDNSGAKNSRPNIRELEGYGRVIAEGRERRDGENDQDYLSRVWNLKHKHAKIRG